MNILKPIDYLLDRITMYRLLLYYLIALVAIAAGLNAIGVLHIDAFAIIFSAGFLTLVCVVTNEVFARVFNAPANPESSYITALILALIITPSASPDRIVFLAAAGGLAIASKYILAIHKRHIFNPAAIAVALTAAGPGLSASWWIGSTAMLPYVVVGGLLVARKIKRGRMILEFLVVAIALSTLLGTIAGHDVVGTIKATVLHSSLFFLAFVMLTEPLTSPPTREKRSWFAMIAGALFSPQVHIFSLYSTPELALLVANVFSYIVSYKRRLLPRLVRKERLAPDIADFVFRTQEPIDYKPGQYMEWTLPHRKSDSRGSRRYLTLASSPTEDTLRIGVKFYRDGSSFKRALVQADSHTNFAAGELGGDFVLPDDPGKKLAFIAGGIGITPYRSMIKYLLDTEDRRAVTLLYSEVRAEDLVYTDIFQEAEQQLGIKTVYTLTGPEPPNDWKGNTGFIDANMITAQVPDYSERIFYISGPHTMVTAIEHQLKVLGVPQRHIKTDFFPGYA